MQKIFSNFGIEIHETDGSFYLTYDMGGIAVQMTTIEVSKVDAEKAQLSAEDAYEVISKHQNIARKTKS